MLETPKVCFKLKTFAKLNSKPIFEQVTPSRSSGKKGKSFGADLPHPGCYKVQKVPGYIGLRQIITQNILAIIM